jgi:hypothetical protein
VREGTGFNALETILEMMRYMKLRVKCVSRKLTPDHKEQILWVCSDFLEQYETVVNIHVTSTEAATEIKCGYTTTIRIQSIRTQGFVD